MGMGINMWPGDPSRVLKWRQFHEHLRVPRDENEEVNGVPMLQVYETCHHFIRTVPALIVDPNNIEEIDSAGEDHCGDEAALLFMARPIFGTVDAPKILRPPKDITEVKNLELVAIMEEVKQSNEMERAIYEW